MWHSPGNATLYSGKREVSIHPLTSTDFHNVGLAIKNEVADTSL